MTIRDLISYYPFRYDVIKRSNISSDIDSLLEVMKDKTNRKCKFVDCLKIERYDKKQDM